MAIYRDTAVVLRSMDIGEADKLLTLFGRYHGKFKAIAKGVRRLSSRKRGHLETFSVCRISCAEGKSLDIVVEAASDSYVDLDGIKTNSISRLGFATRVLEKLLPEEVPDRELFDDWVQYLKGQYDFVSTNGFVLNVLEKTGFLSTKVGDIWKENLESEKTFTQMKKWFEKIVDMT